MLIIGGRKTVKTARDMLWFAIVWMLAICLVGFLVTKKAITQPSLKNWQLIPATVLHSDIQRDAEHFMLKLTVTYDWKGRLIQATTRNRGFDPGTITGAYADISRLRDRTYSAGSSVNIYVNPEAAEEFVLNPSRSGWLVTGSILFMFFLVGFALFISAVRCLNTDNGQFNLSPMSQTAIVGFFFVASLIVGVLTMWKLTIDTIIVWQKSSQWSVVPCNVIENWIDHGSRGTTAARMLYEYVWDGRTYRSDRSTLMGVSDNVTNKRAILESFAPGSEHLCYVDPRDPYSAVMDRNLGWRGLFLFFPVPFLAIGVLGTGMMVRRGIKGKSLIPLSNRSGHRR